MKFGVEVLNPDNSTYLTAGQMEYKFYGKMIRTPTYSNIRQMWEYPSINVVSLNVPLVFSRAMSGFNQDLLINYHRKYYSSSTGGYHGWEINISVINPTSGIPVEVFVFTNGNISHWDLFGIEFRDSQGKTFSIMEGTGQYENIDSGNYAGDGRPLIIEQTVELDINPINLALPAGTSRQGRKVSLPSPKGNWATMWVQDSLIVKFPVGSTFHWKTFNLGGSGPGDYRMTRVYLRTSGDNSFISSNTGDYPHPVGTTGKNQDIHNTQFPERITTFLIDTDRYDK